MTNEPRSLEDYAAALAALTNPGETYAYRRASRPDDTPIPAGRSRADMYSVTRTDPRKDLHRVTYIPHGGFPQVIAEGVHRLEAAYTVIDEHWHANDNAPAGLEAHARTPQLDATARDRDRRRRRIDLATEADYRNDTDPDGLEDDQPAADDDGPTDWQ